MKVSKISRAICFPSSVFNHGCSISWFSSAFLANLESFLASVYKKSSDIAGVNVALESKINWRFSISSHNSVTSSLFCGKFSGFLDELSLVASSACKLRI